MKKLSFTSIWVILVLLLNLGCEESVKNDSGKDIQTKTEQSMLEANKQVGLPAIINFQEKKIMKQIYELRDQEKLVCYAYLFNKMTGNIGQYLGKCIGYGLPYSTQFSNPQKLVDVANYGIDSYQANDAAVISQPEPNGLFMPDGLSATWLLLIDPKTKKARPVYIEPEIIVSPFPLHKIK